MIERIYILESVDPVIFYGVNNSNMQLIKTFFRNCVSLPVEM